MTFSLIICTYMRPEPLLKLLQSVREQSLYPSEIIIVDGSTNNETELILQENIFLNLQYYLASEDKRGLTKQRNFGISKASNNSEIVCFLDDDTVLEPNYFEEILAIYNKFPEAFGVGGYIINEENWQFVGENYKPKYNEFYFDGYKIKEAIRFIARKFLGLDSNVPPGFSPNFSHGRSVSFLPPTNKVYPVLQFMGGVSSFRKSVFDNFQFSTYFEGYGLYEDADFTLRVSKSGKLYLNTAAKLSHYHAPSGRPNQYQYGKMVVRNGFYVWRVKNSNPKFLDKLKWNLITILLTFIRFINIFTTNKRKEAFTETLGRIVGWVSLFYNKPKVKF